MPTDKLGPFENPEVARLAIGWEIVRASNAGASHPVDVAKVLVDVIRILKSAETPLMDLQGDVTIHPLSPRDSSAARGGTLRIGYSFTGGPTTAPLTVFVHFFEPGGDGSPVWGDDHDPPKRTTEWSGATSYTRDIVIPNHVRPGTYRVGIGLYDRDGSGKRLELKTAGGVASDGGKRYVAGSLTIT